MTREDPTVMGRVATRAGLTEGQLYSAVFVVLVALLLSLTGLPTAERQPATGSADIPLLQPQPLDPEAAP